MTVLLKDRARERPAADNKNFLVVLFQFLDECDEVAVAANDDKGMDMIPRERHFQRIEGKIDVSAILVAAWRQVALDHLNGVLRHAAAVLARAFPVAIRDLGDDLAFLFDGFQNGTDIKVPTESAFDSDLDVVEIDEYRDF